MVAARNVVTNTREAKGRFRQRKDLFGLCPRKRGLPQIQVCALYPSSGTAGGVEPGTGKRRTEEAD